MKHLFGKFASKISNILGAPSSFFVALLIIFIWAATGKFFQYSNTWQLIINTGTTIVTFLMVFLIQNTQNRDSRALHLKLDELLKGVAKARTGMVNIESLSDEELENLQLEFQKLQQKYSKQIERK